MTIEPFELRRETVSRSSKKTKTLIVIAGIAFLLIIVGFSVITTLGSTSSSSISSTRNAVCTAKVLGLAQKGIVRDVTGYYSAIYKCTHMHDLSSVYGRA